MSTPTKCYACDSAILKNAKLVDTRDDQLVYVGSSCFHKIKTAGDDGWQPPKGGPRLYLVFTEPKATP